MKQKETWMPIGDHMGIRRNIKIKQIWLLRHRIIQIDFIKLLAILTQMDITKYNSIIVTVNPMTINIGSVKCENGGFVVAIIIRIRNWVKSKMQ